MGSINCNLIQKVSCISVWGPKNQIILAFEPLGYVIAKLQCTRVGSLTLFRFVGSGFRAYLKARKSKYEKMVALGCQIPCSEWLLALGSFRVQSPQYPKPSGFGGVGARLVANPTGRL